MTINFLNGMTKKLKLTSVNIALDLIRQRPTKGEFITIIRKWIGPNTPLTKEQIERLDALKNMKDEDIVFDEGCPPTTEAEGKLFRMVSDKRKLAV